MAEQPFAARLADDLASYKTDPCPGCGLTAAQLDDWGHESDCDVEAILRATLLPRAEAILALVEAAEAARVGKSGEEMHTDRWRLGLALAALNG